MPCRLTASFRSPCIAVFVGLAAFGAASTRAIADDCQPILAAMATTLKAPAYRQYLTQASSGQERLMTVVVGPTVYMMLGGNGRSQQMPRQEIQAMAQEAMRETRFSGCKLLGSETIGGTGTKVYGYSYTTKDGDAGQSKVWIDSGSLLRKQATQDGWLRYEYENVQAPQQ